MFPSLTPEFPWQKVTADFLEFNGVNYLLLVNYRFKYPKVAILQSICGDGCYDEHRG